MRDVWGWMVDHLELVLLAFTVWYAILMTACVWAVLVRPHPITYTVGIGVGWLGWWTRRGLLEIMREREEGPPRP